MDAEHARHLIVGERERLESLVRERGAEGIGTESETENLSELSSNDQHQGDIGTETFEREKDFSLLEQLEAELGDLDAALRKVDEGTYGICEICDREIGAERLEAMPGTRTCIEHAGSAVKAFSVDALGRFTEEREFKVEAPRAVAYAAATNDTNERHTRGELAPPVFAIVPVWDVMTAAAGLVTPPEAFGQVVHSEQDMRFFRPIASGDLLRSKAAPVFVSVRGVGTTVAVRTETVDAGGRPVNEQFVTLFFRGPFEGESGGEPAPDHKLTAATKATPPVAEVTYGFDADQTFRYAEASGDPVPIHLDDAAARAVGLPGIIIHGLCTMAFCGRAVIDSVAGGDPTRLARLAVKFSRPVLPGQEITVRIYADGDGTYGFEALNAEGQAVVKDGRAKLSSRGTPPNPRGSL